METGCQTKREPLQPILSGIFEALTIPEAYGATVATSQETVTSTSLAEAAATVAVSALGEALMVTGENVIKSESR
jgi:hypothetical protein